MTDMESVVQALKDSLRNQHCGFIENVGNVYAVSEETINDTLELLTEQEAEVEHLKRPDCEHAEHDGIGCLGYCGNTQDDEPIESCKRCEKYTGNVYEAEGR